MSKYMEAYNMSGWKRKANRPLGNASENSQVGCAEQGVGVSNGHNRSIVSELKSMLTADQCFICFRSASINNHYKTRKHVIKVLLWISGNAARFNFNVTNAIFLYCEVCNDVFESVGTALFHYSSDKHNKEKVNYCETCKKHVLDIDRHRSTNSHINTLKRVYNKNVEIEEGPSIQENETYAIQSSVLTKGLEHMISTLECNLDSLKLQRTDTSNSGHRAKSRVKKWIDTNNSCPVEGGNAFDAELGEYKSKILAAVKTEYDERDHEPLKEKILAELNEIIDKICFSNTVPYEDALARLRELNRNITGAAVTGENSFSIPDFDTASSKFKIENLTENHSKQKLAMEIRRAKLVLTNHNRINVETALQYLVNLNRLVRDLISKRTEFYDIVDIFEIDCKSNNCLEANGAEEELRKLEDSLMDGNKIKVDVALDCITQFNVQLEKLLFSPQ